MNKQDLLNKFKALKGNTENSNNCDYCNNCNSCDYCNNCNSCLLCKGLSYKDQGYWLLNEEVTKKEFEKAKKLLMG